jgi:hypothetical protein
MKDIAPTSPFLASYTSQFRQQVHELIDMGFKIARPRITVDAEEEDISDFIANAIEEITKDKDSPAWCHGYEPHNEKPISGGLFRGKSRKEIDISIKWISKLGHPEYVFEAKCLNYSKKHQREANYTGKEALQRFLKGEYA